MSAMRRYWPFAVVDVAMSPVYTPEVNSYPQETIPSEPVGGSSAAPADPNDGVIFTTTARGQNKNYTPDVSAPAEQTVTKILPTEPWPSASELTAYSAPAEAAAAEIKTPTWEAPTTTSPDATSPDSVSPLQSPLSPVSSTPISHSAAGSVSFVSTASSASVSTSTSTTAPGAAALTATSTNESIVSSGGTSKTTKIAIAVPVSIIGTALLLALCFFLARRRRCQRERNALPPSYDIATQQTTATSTQELMMAQKSATPEPSASVPTPTMAVPTPRIPLISVSPSTEDGGRTPSPGPSTGSTSVHRMSAQGPRGSEPELGIAVAVPMDRRWSATEEMMGRVGSVRSSRGPSRLARMPFEDFEDDEVGIGIGIAVGGDDDAVSEVSDDGRRERERDFDEVSVVSSFDGVSPIGQQERSQFR
ncbi:uncharacterized protein N7515_007511 [Penicillium bovifimosum]|uniref:Mid2 domain-containing protein n=1 Tax=Penicillium bovifimosum TaxID=126998 RepID=A0A9W9GWR5_9EURO|nr:uncharacterized protein N7515_007511 [Penicillium bovifimosum]KAJ5131472.1 hypothetical protein N7515_007511 [Penicillium bovifimosum]